MGDGRVAYVTEQKAERKIDAVMAVRVCDLPEPHVPSEKDTCLGCQELVWIAQSTVPVLLLQPDVKIYCVQCAANRRWEP
jgi:hypothetical protein